MIVVIGALLAGVGFSNTWKTIFSCDGDGLTTNRIADINWRDTVNSPTAGGLRICSKGSTTDCVTAKGDNPALGNLQLGETLLQDENLFVCRKDCVSKIWSGSANRLSAMEYWCPPGKSDGQSMIYHACGNVNGLHMAMETGHCEWSWNGSSALEVQILMVPTPSPTYKQEWVYRPEWNSISYCDGSNYMTGLCASGGNEDCRMYRLSFTIKSSGLTRCTLFDAISQHSGRWEMSMQFGYDVSCNLDQGYVAVGACNSGKYRGCKCNGGSNEGCDDRNKAHSHMLRCAKGIELMKPFMTQEIVAKDYGNNIACPLNYVMYEMCSSGEHRDCRDRNNNPVSHKIGCVMVKTLADKKNERTISKANGEWKAMPDFNQEFETSISRTVTNTNTETQGTTDNRAISFSADFSVGVEQNTSPVTKLMASATYGLSEEWGQEITSQYTKTISTANSQTSKVNCGDEDLTTVHTVWRWYWESTTATGAVGPQVATESWRCLPGDNNDANRPRCIPGLCMDAFCKVCKYDYCQVMFVENGAFAVNTKCFDKIIGTKTWSGLLEIEHVKGNPRLGYKGKNPEGVVLIKKGRVTVTRNNNANGYTTASWNSDEAATVAFETGHSIRVLKAFSPGVGRSMTDVARVGLVTVGLPVIAAALLAFTLCSRSKATHTEISEGLLA